MTRHKKIAVPREVVRWFSSLMTAPTGPAADVSVERPRVAYSAKGKVAKAKLTPRAIQVLEYLQTHPKASSHDIEQFLVAKAGVPIDSAPNAFRGAMARLRRVDAIRAQPLLAEAPERAPRKARKH